MPLSTRSLTTGRAGLLRRLFDHPSLLLPRDFSLFLIGARTDAAIERTRRTSGSRAAFEEAYTRSHDPWASASPRYRYQQRKYEQIMSLLPDRPFLRTLDLGCGLGLLSQRLATRSGSVLGLDVASAALGHARERATGIANLTFAQGDILDLSADMDGGFDLIVLADVLYYLSPLDDRTLKTVSARVANLLKPGGLCLLANHFFFWADPDSRQSRRIHDAFTWSPRFASQGHHRRAFFLATLLLQQDAEIPGAALGSPREEFLDPRTV
jgi:SAM-dependent methyltransferase